MDVSARNVKIWRKDYQGKDGEFYRYSVSVSKRTQDGRFINAYIPVTFSKRSDAPEKIDNGALCDFEGFVSVKTERDRDGNTRNVPCIVVMSVEFDDVTTGVDSFEQAETEIPF